MSNKVENDDSNWRIMSARVFLLLEYCVRHGQQCDEFYDAKVKLFW